jgi:hypothetical protein
MRTLYEIIEDCKTDKRPEYDELRYALLVMTGILNLVNHELCDLYISGKMPTELIRKFKISSVCSMYGKALGKSPKEYLGWHNDPENPEYQKFHELGNRIVEKALNCELPNQRRRE